MPTAQVPATEIRPRTAIRWRVCALLLISTTLVYLNRTTLSVLKPLLEDKLHFGDAEYGWLQFSFTTAYTIMFVFAGRFVDYAGAKIALAAGVIFWSLATAAGGFCRAWQQLAIAQFFLGCGASVNFPASFKAVAEWFPQKERALSAGIFNSGSNLGIMVAFIAVMAADRFGWPWAFYIVGATGFLWLALWIPAKAIGQRFPSNLSSAIHSVASIAFYIGIVPSVIGLLVCCAENPKLHGIVPVAMQSSAANLANSFGGWRAAGCVTAITAYLGLLLWLPGYFSPGAHPDVSPEEVNFIRAGIPPAPPRVKFRWTEILRYRQAWPFLIAKFLTDPVWWFYSNWLPDYLHKTRGLSVVGSAGWLAMPYIAADVGSICGGWLSGALMKRGFAVGPARYIAMGICALGMPGAIVAVHTNNFWLAISLISMATAAHQGWSANLFTTASDLFPTSVVGSVVGLGGMTGGVGGMIMTLLVGTTLARMGTFVPIFVWAGLMHPLAWIIFFLIAGPRMKRAEMRQGVDRKLSLRLMISGAVIGLIGIIRCDYVWSNWAWYLDPKTHSASAAGGALVAGCTVGLIGAGLVYASLPHAKNAGE